MSNAEDREELITRLLEENAELRTECFDLSAQLAFQKILVASLEEVVKATASLRERT